MTCRWLLFAVLVAYVEDVAETSLERSQTSDVVVVGTSSVPCDVRETVAETSTFAVQTSSGTTTNGKKKKKTTTTTTVDELRNRVAQQTDELSKANAALILAQQHERRMAMLERVKYEHVKTIEDKLLCLVDNVQYTKRGLSDDTSLIQQRPTCRTAFDQAGRRLQLIRRLLAGAELGLVQMQSIKKLSASNTDRRKK